MSESTGERCPHLVLKRSGDEVNAQCSELDRQCAIWYNGDKCDTYEEFLKETQNE